MTKISKDENEKSKDETVTEGRQLQNQSQISRPKHLLDYNVFSSVMPKIQIPMTEQLQVMKRLSGKKRCNLKLSHSRET